ncbi:NAD-dependent DNA ligase LigA [Chitinophaga polysaccharea]|uniref:NAD-dependent DNA ligase LigA n=1 Tax=Chitinophaga TaxID=79328 RepID=UPI0014559FBA|nr:MULTISPECIES: NAD-dependent DNA ligase LigA [Chitinophaga]NLR60569.1 NAD-dependent DNA ligase LigA [Chitinophaga polysaccharea]NLU90540.1 NAD-dependent DNA ligase LigA [Chitinophaga sp. Ak27]
MTYSNKEESRLRQLSEKLLAGIKGGSPISTSKRALTDLRSVITYHNWRYYQKNDPLLSDYEYDQLFKHLQKLEEKYPQQRSAGSPTAHVGSDNGGIFPTVAHLAPMLSLDNTYNTSDLEEWDQRIRRITGQSAVEYCIEPKLDGAGISLIYRDDQLIQGATRGDGAEGEDITANLRQLAFIPATIPFSNLGIRLIELRGEVLISKKDFIAFNKERSKLQLPLMANPRNAAAGTLRLLDPGIARQRPLEVFLYQISYYELKPGKPVPLVLSKQDEILSVLSQLGFHTTYRQQKTLTGIADAIAWCRAFNEKRDQLPYEIDGLVIKVNATYFYSALGMTSHHPRWAVAYKFQPRQHNSKLNKVIFTVGRTGAVTPVAKIDPVSIGGVTVSAVSLFNEQMIKKLDLRIGDTVLVERAGDVIPHVVKAIKEVRKGTEKRVIFPHTCPACGARLSQTPGEAQWYCTNPHCPAQVIEHILHFSGRKAMDIKGLGESHVQMFFDRQLLKDIPSIYQMDYDKIAALEGWGNKSAARLRKAVEHSKQQPLDHLIYGLGIRYVGETSAKVLAGAVHQLMDLADYSVSQLAALTDIGPKVAASIFEFFHDKDNIRMLQKLAHLGVNVRGK